MAVISSDGTVEIPHVNLPADREKTIIENVTSRDANDRMGYSMDEEDIRSLLDGVKQNDFDPHDPFFGDYLAILLSN